MPSTGTRITKTGDTSTRSRRFLVGPLPRVCQSITSYHFLDLHTLSPIASLSLSFCPSLSPPLCLCLFSPRDCGSDPPQSTYVIAVNVDMPEGKVPEMYEL